MNKLGIIAAATLTVATFGAAAAFAQSGTSDFAMADGNKDNIVSMAEAMGVYPTLTQVLFDQADANKDGNLDQSEYANLQGLTAGLTGGDQSSQNSSENGGSSSEGGGSSSEGGGSSSEGGGSSSEGGASSSAM